MKLTRGKINKILNKKNITRKYNKYYKQNNYNKKTFKNNNCNYNLATKTLKNF